MKEMRRILALVLCFVMLVGYLPVGALAADDVQTVTDTPATVSEEGDSGELEESSENVEGPSESIDESDEETEEHAEEPAEGTMKPSVTFGSTSALTGTTTAASAKVTDTYVAPVEDSAGDVVDAAIFFSDLHAGKAYPTYKLDMKESLITAVMTAAKGSNLDFSSVTSVGDAFAVNEDNDSTYMTDLKKGELTGYIQKVLGTDVEVNYTWSDHDRTSDIENYTGLIYGAGVNGVYGDSDDAEYYVFAISMSDMTTSGRYGVASTFDSTTLAKFTDAMDDLDPSKPVFIASHQPLLAERNDNQHAYDWFRVINAEAANRDIILFWGHNHKYDDPAYYYYGVGDVMTVQNGSSTVKLAEGEMNFSHICTGYLSPTTSNTYTRTGTIMVVKLLEDSIVCTTYDSNGVYAGTTNKPGLDVTIPRAHLPETPAEPTINTVTAFDDTGVISVTATALGLTEDGTTVTNVIGDPDLSELFYGYWSLDIQLGGYTGGDVQYSILLDESLDTTNLQLYRISEELRIPLEFEIVTKGTSRYLEFTWNKDGIYAYGEGHAPAGYELTDITIENIPAKYFVGASLALSDSVITATYTKDGEEPFVRHLTVYDWDGCFTGFDSTTPGTNTVTFTFEGVTRTFDVEIYPTSISWPVTEETLITLAPSVPGVTFRAVEENTDADFVRNAMEGLLENYVSYDITLNGFSEGDTAVVTLPIPAGVTKPEVYYIPDNGTAPAKMEAEKSEDGKTVSFVTDHFSTYVIGDSTNIEVPDPEQDEFEDVTTTTPGETEVYYVLDTNGLDVGETYLIVSSNSASNSARYALNNEFGRTSVTVRSGNVDGNAGNETYISVNNSALEWLVEGSSAAYTFKNGVNYLGYTSSSSDSNFYTEYSYALSASNTSVAWNSEGSNLYTNLLYRVGKWFDNEENANYYVTSGNPWYMNRKSSNVYFYKRIEVDTSTTETVKGGTYSVVGNPASITNSSAANGDTATLDCTVTFKANGSNTATSVTPRSVTYAEVEGGDPNNVISLNGNTVTFTGNSGKALVKVTATGYHNNDSTKPYEVTNYIEITAKARVYNLTINITRGGKTEAANDAMLWNQENVLDLSATAVTYVDSQGVTQTVTGKDITWSVPEDMAALVTVENGKFTFAADAIGKDIAITATCVDGDKTYTDTLTVSVVEAIWALNLETPILENGNNVYATDENGNQLLDDEGKPYYATKDITGPIVIKNVDAGETYANVWAVITRDGVNVGNLNDEELANLTFVSSNPAIATVDDKTGVVTFIGAKGTAAITAIYTYANGKSVTDTVLFSVSPDNYYVPEDGTNDFPEYPNEGAIRFDKTATAVGNFSQTGITQVELSMTGVPFGRGVDVVVVIDTSSSMKKDKDGNDLTYGNANSRYGIMKASLKDMLNTFAAADENGNRADIDLAIVDFNGFSTRTAGDNSIPGANLNDSSTDRTATNYGKIYTGDGKAAEVRSLANGVDSLGANHFENTGAEAFDAARIDQIMGYFTKGSSGTNYDFGIEAAYKLLAAKKAANKASGETREQYVIFLSDGAPFRYNGFTCDNSTGRLYMDRVLSGTYADSDDLLAAYPNYGMTAKVAAMYNPVDVANDANSNDDNNRIHLHRMAEAIKGKEGEPYLVVDSTAETNVDGNYLKVYDGLGAKFYSIGFCLADDDYGDRTGVVHEETSYEVIRNLSSGQGYYWEDVESKDELSGAFVDIAKSIVDAAKDVKVVDTMGDKFTMVFDIPNSGVTEALAGTGYEGQNPFYIEVKDYALVPVYDTDGTVIDYNRGTAKSLIKLYLGKNSDGSYYAASDSAGTKFAEPVFTTNPIGTKRYWTTTANDSGISVTSGSSTYYFVKEGNGTHNIASGAYADGEPTTVTIKMEDQDGTHDVSHTLCNDLIIATPYFVYNAATKEMVWTTEKLSTSELAMSYFLYLDNSGGFAGTANEIPADTYTTNKAAYLYYKNFNGVECQQTFPVPQMTWNGAQVSYVFYLVNEDGKPVNRAGTVVPFSEAVYVTDVHTYSIIWNRLEQAAGLDAERLAKDLVPSVYRLYDHNATYSIHVYENEKYVNLNNHFIIEGTEDVNTTYVFNTKADTNKYSAPGVYIADDNNADTDENNREYLCKDYNVTGEYETINNADGTVTYKVLEGVLYTGTAPQWTPGNDDSYTGGTKIGDHVYYVDGEGKIYTIVTQKGAQEVHGGFDFSNTTVAFAVVWVPELKEDTVVLDYGLDVEIDVIANDNLAAGVVGVRSGKRAEPINNGVYGPLNTDQFQNVVDIQQDGVNIAKAVVAGQNSVRFSLDKKNGMQFSDPAVFYYEAVVNERSNNNELKTYNMYSSVTVIPATTVYYEDEYVTLKTYTKDGDTYKPDNGWMVNSTAATATQQTDRPGVGGIGAMYDAENIYGYDKAYESCSTYSLNNAAMVQVVNGQNYATAEFSFYGTGFDVISMTSDKTGTIVVQVSGPESKNFVVDTYYGYKYDETVNRDNNGDGKIDSADKWVPDDNASDCLYQVPVIKVADLPYGKYDVKITASHAAVFDHEQYKGKDRYDFYLDAIRIYDPAGNTSDDIDDVIEDAYAKDGELFPNYYELRNWLIEAELVKNLTEDEVVDGIVFIDGKDDNASVEDYKNYGPNNELYLAKDQAVAFILNANAETDKPAGYVADQIHLAWKSVGGTAKAQVYDAAITDPKTYDVNTATDLYLDITELDGDDKIVIIKNTEGSILSITNIKVTYKAEATAANEPAPASEPGDGSGVFTVNNEVTRKALLAMRTPVVEEEKPEEEIPLPSEPEIIEPGQDETTEPETTEPEESEPEESKPGQEESEVVQQIRQNVKKLVQVLSNLFSKWL